MNGELLLETDEKPGKDDILIVSVMAEKEWIESQTFGLGFIFNL